MPIIHRILATAAIALPCVTACLNTSYADEPFAPQRREGGEQRREVGEQRREGGERAANPLNNFRPQTQREALLAQMIMQLQQELTQLRQEVQQLRVRQGGEGSQPIQRDTETARPTRWEITKEGKVFKAYDQNGDLHVTLDEWLKMKRVQPSDIARKQLETARFYEADPNKDGKMTVEEFLYWYSKGRFENTAEGRPNVGRDGQRDTRDRE